MPQDVIFKKQITKQQVEKIMFLNYILKKQKELNILRISLASGDRNSQLTSKAHVPTVSLGMVYLDVCSISGHLCTLLPPYLCFIIRQIARLQQEWVASHRYNNVQAMPVLETFKQASPGSPCPLSVYVFNEVCH